MNELRAEVSAPGIELQSRVHAALLWEAAVDASTIGVAVSDGVVSLTGETRTFKELLSVRRAVLAVDGVHGVADEIRVGQVETDAISDAVLAHRVVEVFGWSVAVDAAPIQVRVSDRVVELVGEVSSKDIADTAIRLAQGLRGVARVDSHLRVTE